MRRNYGIENLAASGCLLRTTVYRSAIPVIDATMITGQQPGKQHDHQEHEERLRIAVQGTPGLPYGFLVGVHKPPRITEAGYLLIGWLSMPRRRNAIMTLHGYWSR
jgi:hypothetical protein